jgi:fermentation-respiration switch protein FrsA (DUF1100 family)
MGLKPFGVELLLVVFVYLAACAALAFFQRSFIYYPQAAVIASQAKIERLPIANANVLATVREHTGPAAVIFFGGNGDTAALQLPSLVETFPDRAIYLLNYRGYGGSSGRPTEKALQADGLVLFDYVSEKHQDIIVIGRSLGSGIAIRVAARRPASLLILVTPFSSILEIAQRQFPYFPVRWLLVDKYESWRYAPDVRAPTLLIAADRDEVVPRSSTEELYAHFRGGVASLMLIPNTDHNSIMGNVEYVGALKNAASRRILEEPRPSG